MVVALPSPQLEWAWFLDLDGTLLDLAASPAAVVVPKGLVADLVTLRTAAGGALAVISGRPVRQVRDLLEPLRPAAAGLHGLEIVTPDGLRRSPRRPLPPIAGLRQSLQEGTSRIPGVEFENKGATVAVHFRHAPHAEGQLRRLIDVALAKNRGFELLEGKNVFELQPRGIHKGAAIREFMALPPFAGRRPLFVGDDKTDENGFKEVDDMGGITIHVGIDHPTSAQWRVASPEHLRRWLAEAAELLRQKA
jgi:trehalose 6-phosphate phosphatase